MKEIPLTQGYVAIIDDEDYALISAHKWHANVSGKLGQRVYAHTNVGAGRGLKTILKMHRFVLGLSDPKCVVDHINGDCKDNRKCNLRLVTTKQNLRNQSKRDGTASCLKGVTWDRRRMLWKARITVDYREIYLGAFSNEVDAGQVYDAAALEHFGEFARLNFPQRTP